MIRLTLAVIGVFLVGIIVGYVIPSNDSGPISSAPTSKVLSNDDELYQATLNKRDQEIDSLAEEKRALEELFEASRLELEKLKNTHKETVMALVSDDEELVNDEALPNEEVELSEEELEAIRIEREQRRTEFATRVRDSIAERWGDAWDNAPPESQKRISEIAEYQQELFDMRMNIRGANSEEERAEMMKAAEDLNNTLKTTIKSEQNAQLTRLAEKYGISDPKDIKGFLSDTHSQLENPVFKSDFGGRGSFGGGRGDRGGRSGDRGDRNRSR